MRYVALFFSSLVLAGSVLAAPDLLVCSLLSDQVLRFDGATGASLGVFADTHIDGPQGVTVGPDGNVYVASEYSANITKWSPSGAYLGEFVPPMAGWEDLQFGPDGNLYAIAHFGTPDGPVARFDGATGAYLGQWGSGASVSHQHGLTFGPDGNIYIGRTIFGPVGTIAKIDTATGAFLGPIVMHPAIDGIFDLTFHGGFLYSGDLFTGAVHRFNPISGAYMGEFVAAPGAFAGSWGVNFHEDGYLYVSGGGTVRRYDGTTGVFVDDFATGISGSAGFAFLPVPEPVTWLILSSGMVMARRRRPIKPNC